MRYYEVDQTAVDIVNARIIDERDAEQFYIAASIWCDMNGFKYASKFFVNEYHAERRHAHKLQKFLTNWAVYPDLPQVTTVQPDSFNDLVDIIESAYKMEYDLCDKYKNDFKKIGSDNATLANLINCFTKIQADAVIEYADILKVLDGCGEDKFTLLKLEKRLFK